MEEIKVIINEYQNSEFGFQDFKGIIPEHVDVFKRNGVSRYEAWKLLRLTNKSSTLIGGVWHTLLWAEETEQRNIDSAIEKALSGKRLKIFQFSTEKKAA